MPAPDEQPDLLAGLPRTRPQRRSARRPVRPTGADAPAAPPEPESSPPRVPVEPPTGRELVGSTAQAAGELAQLGVRVGRRALRSALGRLPRP